MWVIGLCLLIPKLGVAILLTDAWRQRTLPFHHRIFWSNCLQGLGYLTLIASAVILIAGSAVGIQQLNTAAVTIPLLILLALNTALTGILALRAPRTWPFPDEDWDNPDVVTRCTPHSLVDDPANARLRSSAWLMTLYPLLLVMALIGIPLLVLFAVAIIILTAVVQTRRAFQSQLLWLLAVAIRNHLPLAPELRELGRRRGLSLKRRLESATTNLERGDPLWLVLDRSRLLPVADIAAIQVADGGDRLEETLRRLAVHSSERFRVFNLASIADVLTQTMVTLCATFTILGGLLYFIIPKYKAIFDGFDAKLPPVTQSLVNSSDGLIYRGFSPFLFWIGLGIAAVVWKSLQHIIGWSSLPFPYLMHFQPRRDAPEVLRVIGGIVRCQASLPEKLSELVLRRGRPDLGARYKRLANRLAIGDNLAQALHEEQLISPLQREALSAAERAGHLEFVLFSLAEAIEQREYRHSATWAELVKPVAVLVCAVVVGYVAIALFMPLITLLENLA